jgi:hypothetical protein
MLMPRFLSRAQVFLTFTPPPSHLLFALNLPCRLVGDALSGMVNVDLLLLLPLHPHHRNLKPPMWEIRNPRFRITISSFIVSCTSF